jgi:DHA1 family bicyclomycin/chloramphenicol resistance-like MFS transporter
MNWKLFGLAMSSVARDYPGDSISLELVLALSLFSSLTVLTVDAILPVLDVIAIEIASIDQSQNFILLFFWGLAVGQLFIGSFSDIIGRKRSIYLGLMIFVSGSLVVVLSQRYELILSGRFLQGLGASFARTTAVSIIRDSYGGHNLTKMLSYVLSATNVVFIISPLIGQIIYQQFGWRAIFTSLIYLSIVLFVWMIFRLPETLRSDHKRSLSARNQLNSLCSVVGNKKFIFFTSLAGVSQGVIVSYLLLAKIILLDLDVADSSFSLYFCVIGSALVFGGYMTPRLVGIFDGLTLSTLSLALILLCSIVCLSCLSVIEVSTSVFVIYCFFVLFNIGVLLTTSSSMALNSVHEDVGLASSVNGSLSIFVAIFMSTLTGWIAFYYDPFLVLVASFCFFSAMAIFLVLIGGSVSEAENQP